MSGLFNWRRFARTVACGAAALALSAGAALAQSGEPIKIGFSMALTGPLAANGKMSLLAMKIWEDDINKPGRPARPPGAADLLRRSEQPGAGSRHLLQAARRRQGRLRGQRLCLDPDRTGDADRDRRRSGCSSACSAPAQRQNSTTTDTSR